MPRFLSADVAVNHAINQLKDCGEVIDAGHWQGIPTEGKPDLVTQELMNMQLDFPIPLSADEAKTAIGPNLPWAENHFQERVGRESTNPGKEYLNWPWWRGQDAQAMDDSGHELIFTHTYQERFWPKRAGWKPRTAGGGMAALPLKGIRYAYGDLDDVVNLLRREPHTRQATFPIFFPEDTGAVHGGRVPCTLHYHFLLRNNRLHMWYPIRSCDAVRHFRDDLYMACRLNQWVIEEIQQYPTGEEHYDWDNVEPGILHFTAYSFHVHMGDRHLL